MKKLSICIPTYNRSTMLLSQLDFLKAEFLPIKDSFEIIVADNNSSIEHRNKLIEYHKSNPFFELKLNQTNLGSIGNIYYLLDCAQGEYVWFVSDDDILLEGLTSRVFEILSNNEDLNYIYLNYGAFSKTPDIIDYIPNMCRHSGYYLNGTQVLIDLFKENGTVSMFITSCIYATKPLKEYCAAQNIMTLIDPLLFSFVLANGPSYIENQVFVLERCQNFSWSDESLAIFSWQVPCGLIELQNYNYTRIQIRHMIFTLYFSNRANYLRMLIQSPSTSRNKIIKILSISQISLLILSLFFNLKRIILKPFELFFRH